MTKNVFKLTPFFQKPTVIFSVDDVLKYSGNQQKLKIPIYNTDSIYLGFKIQSLRLKLAL